MSVVYVLNDPRTGLPRYVGFSIDPGRRYKEHLKDRSNTHKCHWIRSLLALGLSPALQILEETERPQEREKLWIAHLLESGADLVNDTEGGDGNPNPSAHVRANMSAGGRKLRSSLAVRAAMSARATAQWASPSAREEASARVRGTKRSASTKLKLSEAASRPESLARLAQVRTKGQFTKRGAA